MTPVLQPTVAQPLDLRVAMSDGVELAVHRYAAPTGMPAPAIVTMTPYLKEGHIDWARALNAAGYEVLIADVRGINASLAPYQGLLSEREIQDGVELVEWTARQPFCDGGVGLGGSSYRGGNQLLIAARQPKGLRCIAPAVSPVDTYRDMFQRGAMPTHTWWGTHTYLPSRQVDTIQRGLRQFYGEVMTGLIDDEAHHRRSPEAGLRRIICPALVLGGLHDYFLRGTIRAFTFANGPKRLVIGPWGHCDTEIMEELLPWYDYWLRGHGTDPTYAQAVRLYRTGTSAEAWETREAWVDTRSIPWQVWRPLETACIVPVHANLGTVGVAPNPKRQHANDSRDGLSTWAEDVVLDMTPMTVTTDLTGPVGLQLALRSPHCHDLDIRARLSAVASNGDAIQLIEGRLRASHRAVDPDRSWHTRDGDLVVPWHTHNRLEPLPSDRVVTIDIEIDPICHRLAPGERLRLGITTVRADTIVAPSTIILEPATRLLLPVRETKIEKAHKGYEMYMPYPSYE